MQRMGFVPIFCINVNVNIGTMLKFDTSADANVDFDAKCEQTLSGKRKKTLSIESNLMYGRLHNLLTVR